MTSRLLRGVAWLTLKHPVSLLAAIALLTAGLYLNIHNLRMGTNLADLFGDSTPELRAVNEYAQNFGYSNQLFVLVEDPGGSAASESMETLGDRLVSDMNQSGLFKYARCGLSEQEMLGMVRLFAWNFRSYAKPEQVPALRERLSTENIRKTVGVAGAGLVTAFSSLGTNYFANDPLGLMQVVAPGGGKLSGLGAFDMEWGSGNYFFSRDHRALLVISEPRQPMMNYKAAEEVVRWTRSRCRSLLAEEDFRGLRLVPAGGYIYAEQDRGFIQENIKLVSLVSIIGNLILCGLVYRRPFILLLSFIPTSLGLLWTTGLISYYPGEINLISLSFIAILVGLGDDQVVYFVGRVPQEWRDGRSLQDALARTYATTGKSIVFCILTIITATAALALSSFKGLAEFGFVLTVGLLMLLVHTLLTIPALMRIGWQFFPPRVPTLTSFRFLPSIVRPLADLLGRYPKAIFIGSVVVFAVAAASLPAVHMAKKVEIARGDENPATIGQNRLAKEFGIEGTPELLLIQGTEEEALGKSEALSSELDRLAAKGLIKAAFSPSDVVPSREMQLQRAKQFEGVDLAKTSGALEETLKAGGFNPAYFDPAIQHLRKLAAEPHAVVTLSEAMSYLPRGFLENSIQKIGTNRYMAAIAVFSADPNAAEAIPDPVARGLKAKVGGFVDFSYAKMSRDLQTQIFHDSRRALFLTAAGIMLIVFLCFRNVLVSALVLLPLVFGIVVTFGGMHLAGYRFSFMALIAVPLIIGLGIDNGIHLARRYLFEENRDIVDVLRLAGAPLLQSNLTTMVGFGALTVSKFQPLAELGLVTTVGVAVTLCASMFVFPAIVSVFRIRGSRLVSPPAAQKV
ncbi:MAG: MMPL family transporter [Bryobacteraceae bacterium]|jgi:predicted RND superfamily exporter protein